jgi:protein involved in polysaccharide export with SLBB domain
MTFRISIAASLMALSTMVFAQTGSTGTCTPPNCPTLTTAQTGVTAQGGMGGGVVITNTTVPQQGGQRSIETTGGDQRQEPGNSPTPKTPSPQNEFQRFVAANTGQNLTMFGESYFSGGPQTYAPLDRVPVPADYVLGPGDELYIRAWGNIDIDYRATIDRNGQISIPRVGTINVAGLKAADAEGQLRAQIGRVFKGFSLSVTLGQLRSIQIFVVGQARQPGTYTVGSLSTLVNAIFASGGPGNNGSMRRVQLRRANRVVTELDLYDFLVQGDKGKDMALLPGDVIVFPAAGPRIAVLGAVDTPAIYELKPGGTTLYDMLTLSGASRAQANVKSVLIERIDPTDSKVPRRVLRVDVSQARQTVLLDGDVVRVFAVPPQFANAVTLRGNVQAALRYPYTPGMRISDLIPEREALITPDYYIRKNRLVEFTEPRKLDGADLALSVGSLVDEVNWEYAAIERLDTDRITTKLLPFNLGKAVLEHDPVNDLALQPGDVVTIFSTKDIRAPQYRSVRLARLEGEVERPGVYQLQPGETLRALIQRAGGFTPQAYVYGLDLSREETRLKQRENLAAAVARLEALAAAQSARLAANRLDLTTASTGAAAANAATATSAAATQAQIARFSRLQPNGRIALELEPTAAGVDALPDVLLENADRIVVPTRPGFVSVSGAVVNSNSFLWRPGRTVGDYIKLAGLEDTAELSSTFVLRADGTVKHANDNRSLFGVGGLQSLPLFPGDAVVVPNQLDFETWGSSLVRNLKDWSQIFSQFGLGAAAIKSLRQ